MSKNQKPPVQVDPVAETEASPAADVAALEVQPDTIPSSPVGEVKVRILRDCVYGKCDDVVPMDAALADSLAGVVDADPAAVEYAESLAK